jgi:hypothetical protein
MKPELDHDEPLPKRRRPRLSIDQKMAIEAAGPNATPETPGCREGKPEEKASLDAAAAGALRWLGQLQRKRVRPLTPDMDDFLALPRHKQLAFLGARTNHRIAAIGHRRPASSGRPARRTTRRAHSTRGSPDDDEGEGEPAGPRCPAGGRDLPQGLRHVALPLEGFLVLLIIRCAARAGMSVASYAASVIKQWDGPPTELVTFMALAAAAGACAPGFAGGWSS